MLQEIDWGNRERVVRINAMDGPHGTRDIEVIAGRPDALLLAKVQGPKHIEHASRLLARDRGYYRDYYTSLTVIEPTIKKSA